MQDILDLFAINPQTVNYVFPYGSHLYGTNDEQSDRDFIIVCDQGSDDWSYAVELKKNDIEVHLVTPQAFNRALEVHDISALECACQNANLLMPKIDLKVLRTSISQKASHSHVKAKKKLLQGDERLGLKSFFHSIRIVGFGMQIAQHQHIVDFKQDQEIWKQIKEFGTDWDRLNEKFYPVLRERLTLFRKMAPK